jgi:hypothetical protein
VTPEAGQLNHEQPALSESIGMTAELLEGVFTPCHRYPNSTHLIYINF